MRIARCSAAGDKGLRAVVMDDDNDTWAHQVHVYDKEVGAFTRKDLRVARERPAARACCARTLSLRHLDAYARLDAVRGRTQRRGAGYAGLA